MSKHTPGPWTDQSIDESQWSVFSADGFAVAQAQQIRPSPEDPQQTERTANVRLIAAAPDLIGVVQRFRQKLATYVDGYPGDKELRGLLEDCDAVIQKAAGKGVEA